MSERTTEPFAYYPLDGNVLDFSGNGHHATIEGAQLTIDARGEADKAYKFSSSVILFLFRMNPALIFRTRSPFLFG
jgi:hypothetical protein